MICIKVMSMVPQITYVFALPELDMYTAKNFTTKSGLRVRGGGCFLTLQVLSLICPPLWCQVLPSQKSIIVVSKTGLGYKAKV